MEPDYDEMGELEFLQSQLREAGRTVDQKFADQNIESEKWTKRIKKWKLRKDQSQRL
jgi:hypothetical protein